MKEPCMCGDPHCWICGPLQGFFRCPACGKWSDDGCEDTEKCEAEIKKMDEAEAERCRKYPEEE